MFQKDPVFRGDYLVWKERICWYLLEVMVKNCRAEPDPGREENLGQYLCTVSIMNCSLVSSGKRYEGILG